MRPYRLLFLAAFGALALAGKPRAQADTGTPAGTSAVVVLDAHFEDKPLDQPIGTGGAAVGEPVFVAANLDAIVRAGSGTGARLLELSNPGGGSAASTRFEFLDQAEYSNGTLHFDLELVVEEAANHNGVQVYLREQGGSARAFLNVVIAPTGSVSINGSGIAPATFPGLAGPGIHRLELLADLDTRDIRVWLNEAQVGPAQGFRHDIEDRGIGRVIVGMAAHPTYRRAGLDYLWAGWVPGDPLFADGFEAVD